MDMLNIKDNSILIVSNNIHKKVVNYLSNQDKLFNIKIMSFNDIQDGLLFKTDVKAINYIMSNYNVNYSIACKYIDSLISILDNNNQNTNITLIKNIYNDLIDNDLLIYDSLFINLLKQRENLYVYGYISLTKYQKYLLELIKKYINVIVIKPILNEYSHTIYKLTNIEKEVTFVFEQICKLLDNKVDINNIYLSNVNDFYIPSIERLSNLYNIPINLNSNLYLYETEIGKYFLNNLNLDKDILLDNIKNKLNNDLLSTKIFKILINFIDKFYWINKLSDIKYLVINEFKKLKIPSKIFSKAINIEEINDNIFKEDDYVFLLNFNINDLPKTKKNEDFIDDKIKPHYIDTTDEINKIIEDKYIKSIKSIKNLTITYNIDNENDISYLYSYLNYNIENVDLKISAYSDIINEINLCSLLDDYYKYNQIHECLPILYNNYKIDYKLYQNKYNGIDKNLFKNKLKDKLTFSYSSINTYYMCPFKYYNEYILSISLNKKNFKAIEGSLAHYILENINEYSIEELKNKYLDTLDYKLNNKELFFIDKLCNNMNLIIDNIKNQDKYLSYDKILKEERIKVSINNKAYLIGFIDKILIQNNHAIIIDYKTNNQEINPLYFPYGINLQLPIYLYLLTNNDKNQKVDGIFLQHILPDKNIKDIHSLELALKYIGLYTDDIKLFDKTYEKSKIIKHCQIDSKTNLMKENKYYFANFDTLLKNTEHLLTECVDNVYNCLYNISPVVIDDKIDACKYCDYKDICFKQYNDIKQIHIKKEDIND